MARIGIYGGTYNPPHAGHIQAARSALELLKLDRLLLVPGFVAPHKMLPEDSPMPSQRLDMLKLASEGLQDIEVSDLELRREGVSYTYQTVEQLREENPDAELFLIMGADLFLSFDQWRCTEKILPEVTLAVLHRGEKGEKAAVAAKKAALESAGARVVLLENPVLDISSTQLRRMLVFECADPFLPAGVGEYIRQNGLYGTGKGYRNLPMEALEQVVVRLLNPNRVAHVLGCRDTAVRLARRWGADETDAARAALLHDITKALDGPLQLTLCREYATILDDFGSQNPKTLHALTGSMVARRIFGENDAVVEAIRSHTTGKAGMNLLEKIIYVADYMEPCRDFPGVDRLRQLADTDMDAALKLGLEMTIDMLQTQGRMISPESLDALRYLNENTNLC